MQILKNYLKKMYYSDQFSYAVLGLAGFGLVHFVVYVVQFFNLLF